MIWLKRFIPIILLAAAVVGGIGYHRYRLKEEARQTKERALVTARIWFADTRFRDKPELFTLYRDSLLKEAGFSREDMQKYLTSHIEKPEAYLGYTQWLNYYVDSLCDLHFSYYSKNKPDSAKEPSTKNNRNPKQNNTADKR